MVPRQERETASLRSHTTRGEHAERGGRIRPCTHRAVVPESRLIPQEAVADVLPGRRRVECTPAPQVRGGRLYVQQGSRRRVGECMASSSQDHTGHLKATVGEPKRIHRQDSPVLRRPALKLGRTGVLMRRRPPSVASSPCLDADLQAGKHRRHFSPIIAPISAFTPHSVECGRIPRLEGRLLLAHVVHPHPSSMPNPTGRP